MAGIDIGVHRSDRHAQLGKLTRQGSAPLRWALYEAAQSASHRGSPDYHDYHALKARGLSHTRASLTIARKLARRSYHILKALGPAALDPPDQRSDQAHPSPMRSNVRPAPGAIEAPTPSVATHKRQSGRSRSTTGDRPASAGRAFPARSHRLLVGSFCG
jgi:Transposase IS116/IS110/IS902 family